MKVLSLFDGIAGAKQALKELDIDCQYFASEIDKFAIQVAKHNHPDIIHIGDIKEIFYYPLDNKKWLSWGKDGYNKACAVSKIDLLIGGSPCQDLSIAGRGKGLDGERSGLFFEYLRILDEIKPKYFLLENVASMSDGNRDSISEKLGVKPIMINSNLLTAQNRKRLYWTNIKVEQPHDKNISLVDMLEDLPDCPIGAKVREKSNCLRVGGRNSPFGSRQIWDSPFQRISKKGFVKPSISKAACLTGGGNSGGNHSDMDLIHSPIATRRYSPTECERLQGFPDGYTEGISNSQRYKVLGNSFTVPVIKHIIRAIGDSQN